MGQEVVFALLITIPTLCIGQALHPMQQELYIKIFIAAQDEKAEREIVMSEILFCADKYSRRDRQNLLKWSITLFKRR